MIFDTPCKPHAHQFRNLQNSRFNATFAVTTAFVHSAPVTAPPNTVLDPTIPWALCSNGTANGRLDIVFKQLLLQPGFNLTNCRDVGLQMIF